MRAVASFVRELPSIDNLDVVGAEVFSSSTDGRVSRFKQAVNYFLNGTRDHYGRHKNATLSKTLLISLRLLEHSLYQFSSLFF